MINYGSVFKSAKTTWVNIQIESFAIAGTDDPLQLSNSKYIHLQWLNLPQ